MSRSVRLLQRVTLILCVWATISLAAQSEAGDIPADHLVQPAALASQLQGSTAKPLLIHVGSRVMYEQAHIPASEYIGPGSSDEALRKLTDRVKQVPKNTSIILYCGCCPWEHCPNVKPAYAALSSLGFSNVKVLYIANNFGADWADKGYPVATGASEK